MKVERILPFARTLLTRAIKQGDTVIDATMGNGHDTLFLSQLVGDEGRVYAFDVQEEALNNTLERLKEHKLENRAVLLLESHEKIQSCLPSSLKGSVTAAIFNLGYLPGGDKKVVTQPHSTIRAVEQIIDMLAPEGIIVLVIYHGHPEGQLERDVLMNYARELDQQLVHVIQYQFINQQNAPPFIVAIEKR